MMRKREFLKEKAKAWRANVEPAEIQVIVEASDSSDIPEEVLVT